MTSTEQTDTRPKAPPRQDPNLEYVLYAFIALGLVAVAAFVFVYGQRGEPLLRDLSTREPNAVMKAGIRHEWAGDVDAAVIAYRKALALGFGDYWAEFGCKERLTNLLVRRGQLPELKLVGRAELDATNLLANAGFEEDDGTPGWLAEVEDRAGLKIDPMEIIEGKRSLRIDLAQRTGSMLQNAVAVLPRCPYRVSAWMRTVEAPPPGARLAVRALGTDTANFEPQGERFLGTRDWRQIAFTFTPPAGVNRVGLTLEAGEATSGTVWLDQCALVRDEANLLKNGSFETGENGRRFWLGNPKSGVEFGVAPDVALEGNQSFRITYAPGVGQSIWQSASVEEGTAYQLEVWLRTNALDGRGINVTVKDAPTNGKALTKTSPFLNGTKDWTPVRLGFVAPEGIYSVVVSVNRPGNERDAAGTMWIDACSLTRKPEPPAPNTPKQSQKEPASRLRKRPEKRQTGPASGKPTK